MFVFVGCGFLSVIVVIIIYPACGCPSAFHLSPSSIANKQEPSGFYDGFIAARALVFGFCDGFVAARALVFACRVRTLHRARQAVGAGGIVGGGASVGVGCGVGVVGRCDDVS